MYQASVQGWTYIPENLRETLSEAEIRERKQNQLRRANLILQHLKQHTGQSIQLDLQKEACEIDFLLDREEPFNELINYMAATDKVNREKVYDGIQQTQFEHLIKLRNQVSYFVPIFFFFPIRLLLTGESTPIYVGSTIKLKYEVYELNKRLKLDPRSVQKMPDFFKATKESLEDFDNLSKWIHFSFILLTKLVFRSQEKKLPIFFNPHA
ncbi:MAG: hypothetical protein AABZ60_09270 [Planctomycetota bacterium]